MLPTHKKPRAKTALGQSSGCIYLLLSSAYRSMRQEKLGLELT
jgi:hypothetical protein